MNATKFHSRYTKKHSWTQPWFKRLGTGLLRVDSSPGRFPILPCLSLSSRYLSLSHCPDWEIIKIPQNIHTWARHSKDNNVTEAGILSLKMYFISHKSYLDRRSMCLCDLVCSWKDYVHLWEKITRGWQLRVLWLNLDCRGKHWAEKQYCSGGGRRLEGD